jgi:hypothetical protein
MLTYVQLCTYVHAHREIIVIVYLEYRYRYQNACPIVGIGPPSPALDPKGGGGGEETLACG